MEIVKVYGVGRSGITPDGSLTVPIGVGVEVELENVVRNREAERGIWTVHEDGSLRNEGLEFVFAAPLKGEDALTELERLPSLLVTAQTTPRTSVHIHTDMSWSTTEHAQAVVALVYLIENALFEYSNVDRKWCGYSMALETMPEQRLQKMFSSDERMVSSSFLDGRREERYYGLNTHALGKYGTLEWRYFPGTYNPEQLKEWIQLVSQLVYNTRTLKLADVLRVAQGTPEQVRNFVSSLLRSETWRAFERYLTDDALVPNMTALDILQGLSNEPQQRRDGIVFYSSLLQPYLLSSYDAASVKKALDHLKLVKCMTYSEFSDRLRHGGSLDPFNHPVEAAPSDYRDDDDDEDEDRDDDEYYTGPAEMPEPVTTHTPPPARNAAVSWSELSQRDTSRVMETFQAYIARERRRNEQAALRAAEAAIPARGMVQGETLTLIEARMDNATGRYRAFNTATGEFL